VVNKLTLVQVFSEFSGFTPSISFHRGSKFIFNLGDKTRASWWPRFRDIVSHLLHEKHEQLITWRLLPHGMFCHVFSHTLTEDYGQYSPDDEGSKLIWKFDHYMPEYTAQYPRRQQSISIIVAVRTWNLNYYNLFLSNNISPWTPLSLKLYFPVMCRWVNQQTTWTIL
jgi:hypothetical protein